MIATTDLDVTVLEKRALEERPEMRQSRDAARLAEWQRTGARAALLPQLSLRAVFEADRQTFATRGGANWFAGATLHWSFFNGFADRARIEEAAHTLRAAEARGARTSSGVRLEVRRAWADLQASGERVAVASSVVAMAEESARITKNRYEAGLSTVTELLRSETALLEARTRRLAAAYDQRVAAANLELATGALSGDSDVLK
jgi:outer membrane protein TolC